MLAGDDEMGMVYKWMRKRVRSGVLPEYENEDETESELETEIGLQQDGDGG